MWNFDIILEQKNWGISGMTPLNQEYILVMPVVLEINRSRGESKGSIFDKYYMTQGWDPAVKTSEDGVNCKDYYQYKANNSHKSSSK